MIRSKKSDIPLHHHKEHYIRYTTEEDATRALVQLAVFIVFLASVTVVCNTVSNKMLFVSHYPKRLYGREFITDAGQFIQLSDIQNIEDYWLFLEYGVLRIFHGYPETDIPFKTKPALKGRIFLNEHLMLGPPRMRMIRVRNDTCWLNYAFIRYFNTCIAEYSPSIEYTEPIYKGTNFYTSSQLGTVFTNGKLKSYSGNGYVIDFSYDEKKNRHLIHNLKAMRWLDGASRFAVFEYNMYNMNKRLFLIHKFVIEMLPTGEVNPIPHYQVVLGDPLFLKCGYDIVTVAVIMNVLNVYYTYGIIDKLLHLGFLQFFRGFTNYMDIARTLLVYGTFSYHLGHYIYKKDLVIKASESSSFFCLDELGQWAGYYANVSGFLVCITWFSTLKYMDFDPVLKTIAFAGRKAAGDLSAFVVMFLIVFAAFAELGLVLFGGHNEDFKDSITATLTMLRLIISDFNYFRLDERFHYMGPLYFLTYAMIIFFILLNMFLAVVVLAYRTGRKTVLFKPSFMCYVIRKYMYRLSGGFLRMPQYPGTNEKKVILDSAKLQEMHTEMQYEEVEEEMHGISDRVHLIEEVLHDLTVRWDSVIEEAEKQERRAQKELNKISEQKL